MKSFLFILLISTQLYGQNNEMADDNALKNKFVAGVKDAEIESMLERTKEFTDCFKDSKYKYDKADNEQTRENKISEADKCFNEKITKGQKGKEQLKELAEKLNLESYGLIKSKNVEDITSYLTDKMYKAMTGYSRQEKNQKDLIESMKFKNRKMIDQSVFIKLYKTQLSKSALQEMTRYCFEDFRLAQAPPSSNSFKEYWGSNLTSFNPKAPPPTSQFNDLGSPTIGIANVKYEKDNQEKAYKEILGNIAVDEIDATSLNNFFLVCTEKIKELCDVFKTTSKDKKLEEISNTLRNGAKSCLTISKLQEIRKALAQADKVIDQFDSLDNKGVALLLDGNQVTNFYDPTNDKKNSLDKLSSLSSKDILEGNQDPLVQELAEKCKEAQNASDEECEKFLFEGDKNKSEYDIQMQMNLKKQVDMERIKALKKANDKSLKEYLEENGYHELVKEADKLSDEELAERIEDIYEARKKAAVLEFRDKVGSRQASEDELKKDPNLKASITQKNAETTLSERTRLAQVVLFNNIIMGSINLEDKDGKVLGKNISGLEQEVGQLSNIPGLQSSFFEGLKGDVDKAGSNSAIDNSVLGATDLIDSILGKEKEKK